jgi:hypothetical protein
VILVDTTPLVAAVRLRDSMHRTPVRHLESLAAEEFGVCDAMLLAGGIATVDALPRG